MRFTDADAALFCEKRLKELRNERDVVIALYVTKEIPMSPRAFIHELQRLDNAILNFERISKNVAPKKKRL